MSKDEPIVKETKDLTRSDPWYPAQTIPMADLVMLIDILSGAMTIASSEDEAAEFFLGVTKGILEALHFLRIDIVHENFISSDACLRYLPWIYSLREITHATQAFLTKSDAGFTPIIPVELKNRAKEVAREAKLQQKINKNFP